MSEFPDVFSMSKIDPDSCFLIPFKITVPPDSTSVTSRFYQMNPVPAKKMDAVIDQYLATGLIQQSTSQYSRPMLVIPREGWRRPHHHKL